MLLAIVGVAAGAVFLLALPLGIAVQRLYRDDEVLRLERNATAAARGFDASAGAGDPVEFPAGAAASDEIAAYSLTGELLGGEGPPRADSLVEGTLAGGRVTEAEGGGRLAVAVPVLGGERVVGAIRASRSTAELDERVLRVRLLIAGGAILIVGLAAVAALALSRRLTRPLAELADAAATVGRHGPATKPPHSGIDELDVVAEALDAMVRRLDGVLARERAFSANASHQLRTPLAALRLDLESRQLSGAEIEKALVQVDRLERTIDTLLAAARDAPADREPFAIDDLLEDVRRRWVGPLAELGRALEVDQRRDGIAVLAARAVVGEVLDVLLDNARRHGAGTVRIRSRSIAGQLAVDVIDQGEGVLPSDVLFSRRPGSAHGLGLALARSLAEAEGGRLDLGDPHSASTTFTLLLRAAPQSSPGR